MCSPTQVVQTGQLCSRLTACTKTALPCLHTCCALCSSTTCTVVCVWGLEPQLLITQSKSKTASHSGTHSPQSSASGQGTLDCRLHTCTPGTVSTHCKYHSVVCSVCADSSTVYITLSVCIALQRWYKLNKVQSYDSLHKDSI